MQSVGPCTAPEAVNLSQWLRLPREIPKVLKRCGYFAKLPESLATLDDALRQDKDKRLAERLPNNVLTIVVVDLHVIERLEELEEDKLRVG